MCVGVCVFAPGENASELQRCSRYVVKLAGRLDATLQAVHTIYTDRKRRAVDRLLSAYVQVRRTPVLLAKSTWHASSGGNSHGTLHPPPSPVLLAVYCWYHRQ